MEVQHTTITSDLDQDVSPTGPLTVGPGYHRPVQGPPEGLSGDAPR
jgi:hypothetical protein